MNADNNNPATAEEPNPPIASNEYEYEYVVE